MTDFPRLIEKAFCLREASIDSVHEKNVRHGHISTLHIWPARRPLAASRAALIATLLPDPGTPEERRKILERLGGTVIRKVSQKTMPGGRVVDQVKEETEGGILHWGRESGPDLDWFREEILRTYGRPPKVLDPFAGGGAIPLEAMRLGCDVTAVDINPVAWFILKCTLEYPQRLAGKKWPLPEFILEDEEFMERFFKATGDVTPRSRRSQRQYELALGSGDSGRTAPETDLAWQVRAWGTWVLREARKDLARFYPTYAEFEPLEPGRRHEKRGHKLAPLQEDGNTDKALLNSEFSEEYLASRENPRWVPKPTVAYLWARAVKCKDCRATVPLLKTRWLCKKERKRVLLTMEPNSDGTGVVFGIETDVPVRGANPAQRREHDRMIGSGTMSRSGAKCPCCGTIMTMDDIKTEGQGGRLGSQMTAVVVDGQRGKEYRLPTEHEIQMAMEAEGELERVFAEIPFGFPGEPTPVGGSGASRAFSVDSYGFDTWSKLFAPRQLLALGTFVRHVRAGQETIVDDALSREFAEAIVSYMALILDRIAERNSSVCHYDVSRDSISGTFQRYALPITWDFCEAVPIGGSAGGCAGQVDWVARYVEHGMIACAGSTHVPDIYRCSALTRVDVDADMVVTDPPYYDAIPYSDLMDFFYVWLRRTLWGLSPDIDAAFREPLSPKWDHEANDGELIDDSSRHGGDKEKSKQAYEDGMFRAFENCHKALRPEGRLVIVFAHKHPDAWETLVSAIMRAGFVVNGSWPIQTEMGNRTRALSSAALSSSVWLVCKKRPDLARPGWDNVVLEEMQANIHARLREFWDAGIRGPDFVWAATGPALEAYSKYPVVRKANEPRQLMEVSEFLRAVRRIVVDFVVGRVLSRDGTESVTGLDDVTTYYLLHRYDFQMAEAPAGACILYAISCGLTDGELTGEYDILQKSGRQDADEGDESEDGEEAGEYDAPTRSGATVRLKPWDRRTGKTLGLDVTGRPSPLIDQIHLLMRLWRAGDVVKVDEHLDSRGLRRHPLFHKLLQALIELCVPNTTERSLLESISNHVDPVGSIPQAEQRKLAPDPKTD